MELTREPCSYSETAKAIIVQSSENTKRNADCFFRSLLCSVQCILQKLGKENVEQPRLLHVGQISATQANTYDQQTNYAVSPLLIQHHKPNLKALQQ